MIELHPIELAGLRCYGLSFWPSQVIEVLIPISKHQNVSDEQARTIFGHIQQHFYLKPVLRIGDTRCSLSSQQ
jgi:hypothetical protein